MRCVHSKSIGMMHHRLAPKRGIWWCFWRDRQYFCLIIKQKAGWLVGIQQSHGKLGWHSLSIDSMPAHSPAQTAGSRLPGHCTTGWGRGGHIYMCPCTPKQLVTYTWPFGKCMEVSGENIALSEVIWWAHVYTKRQMSFSPREHCYISCFLVFITVLLFLTDRTSK